MSTYPLSNSDRAVRLINRSAIALSASTMPKKELELYDELNLDSLDLDDVKFIISLQDSSGKEFYLHENNTLVCMDDKQMAKPRIVQTSRLETELASVRQRNLSTCHIYGITTLEFFKRQIQIRQS